ncbi:MAG TPA: hypothetical protein VNQ73_21335 [Ilumatobacter sp.]|nr:hypothetical protein [Ilumatobacter sp.]
MTGSAIDAALARRMVLVRTVTFGYAAAWLVVRARYVWNVAGLPERRFEPVGLLTLMDWQPGRLVVMTVATVTLAAAVLATVGRYVAVAAPVAAVGMLLIATLTSSFGQVFHTEHLLVLHLLVLAAYAVATARPSADRVWGARWAIGMLGAVTAVTYVVAGVAKLRMSGFDWVSGDVLRNWVAIDNLRKLLLDDPYSPVGGALAGVGWVWPPIAAATLLVELGAPLAVLVRRVAVPWVVAAWAFHVGVLAVMAISFPYQLTGVAYLALLPAERIEARVRSLLRRPPTYTRSTCRNSC